MMEYVRSFHGRFCKSKECLTKAVRQKQLDRALETKIDEAVLSQLMEEVDET